jgi:hypothetical protein
MSAKSNHRICRLRKLSVFGVKDAHQCNADVTRENIMLGRGRRTVACRGRRAARRSKL